jgi:hypothetical protein
MGAVILYILNFSILFLLSFCKSEEWYRRLPEDKRESSNFIIGVYQKKNQNRAPMNSKIYTNELNEKIIFFKNGEFKKEFNQNEVHGFITKTMEISIEGKYLINGNWILLNYLNYNSIVKEDFIKIEKSSTFNKKLLYYYNDKKKYIIPMVYELGLLEKDFGVKDGIKIPYKEDDPLFLISLKNYSEKEFRTHAFYFDEVNK